MLLMHTILLRVARDCVLDFGIRRTLPILHRPLLLLHVTLLLHLWSRRRPQLRTGSINRMLLLVLLLPVLLLLLVARHAVRLLLLLLHPASRTEQLLMWMPRLPRVHRLSCMRREGCVLTCRNGRLSDHTRLTGVLLHSARTRLHWLLVYFLSWLLLLRLDLLHLTGLLLRGVRRSRLCLPLLLHEPLLVLLLLHLHVLLGSFWWGRFTRPAHWTFMISRSLALCLRALLLLHSRMLLLHLDISLLRMIWRCCCCSTRRSTWHGAWTRHIFRSSLSGNTGWPALTGQLMLLRRHLALMLLLHMLRKQARSLLPLHDLDLLGRRLLLLHIRRL